MGINAKRSAEILSDILYEEERNCGWVTDDDEDDYKEKIEALKFAIETLGKESVEISIDMKWNDYPSDTLYLWNGEVLFTIAEGTGDNLWQEDIDEGYVDYWMTETWGDKGDGGQWMEKKPIHDIDYTIQGVIDRMMECDLWEDDWDILDPEQGEELREELEEKYIRQYQ